MRDSPLAFHRMVTLPTPLASDIMQHSGRSAISTLPGLSDTSTLAPYLSMLVRMAARTRATSFEQHFLCSFQCAVWHSAEQ